MKRRHLGLIAAATCLLMAPAASARPLKCVYYNDDTFPSVHVLRALGTGCESARDVAQSVRYRYKTRHQLPRTVVTFPAGKTGRLSWTCRYRRVAVPGEEGQGPVVPAFTCRRPTGATVSGRFGS